MAPRSSLTERHMRLAAERRAGDQVAVAADIFGQGIDDDIDAVLQRLLEDRAEQRVSQTTTGAWPWRAASCRRRGAPGACRRGC